jgi:hypothetical protein
MIMLEKGKIVSGLFNNYMRACYDEPVGAVQFAETRNAFFAGAKGIIDTIQAVTDAGDDATDAELAFMDDIYAELTAYGAHVAASIKRSDGAANSDEPPPVLGDMPIEEQYRVTMQAIAHTLDEFLNPDSSGTLDRATGFVLMVFPFGEHEGRANYISNGADRQTVAQLMEQQAKRFREQDA